MTNIPLVFEKVRGNSKGGEIKSSHESKSSGTFSFNIHKVYTGIANEINNN
jgi:hypothetical protein